jgi:hypothetical protein
VGKNVLFYSGLFGEYRPDRTTTHHFFSLDGIQFAYDSNGVSFLKTSPLSLPVDPDAAYLTIF